MQTSRNQHFSDRYCATIGAFLAAGRIAPSRSDRLLASQVLIDLESARGYLPCLGKLRVGLGKVQGWMASARISSQGLRQFITVESREYLPRVNAKVNYARF